MDGDDGDVLCAGDRSLGLRVAGPVACRGSYVAAASPCSRSRSLSVGEKLGTQSSFN